MQVFLCLPVNSASKTQGLELHIVLGLALAGQNFERAQTRPAVGGQTKT